jgi:L-ascorbate metabolism protein UlaG (beta-lactamase superfamily)
MTRIRSWTGTAILLLLAGCSGTAPAPPLRVHYLGHASFLLTGDDGLSVLTDYGESNAYGLDSPIYGLGSLIPDVVTLSHRHADHAGGTLPPGVNRILRGLEEESGFEEKGLRITAIPTYEGQLDTPDNTSFLFEYGGLKVLHLGDCQALMTALAEPGVRERIQALYPDTYDLVLLPIGFVTDIVEPAAVFAGLLDARRIVPMHYWSPADRDRFLDRLAGRTDGRGRPYRIVRSEGPDLALDVTVSDPDSVTVIGLSPAPWTYRSPGG